MFSHCTPILGSSPHIVTCNGPCQLVHGCDEPLAKCFHLICVASPKEEYYTWALDLRDRPDDEGCGKQGCFYMSSKQLFADDIKWRNDACEDPKEGLITMKANGGVFLGPGDHKHAAKQYEPHASDETTEGD